MFPDREVKIFVGTWNMNGQAPPRFLIYYPLNSDDDDNGFKIKLVIPHNYLLVHRELADFIFPDQVKHVPDIFAIGTQESYSERTEWEITIQEVLGPTHLLLHSYYLGKWVRSVIYYH